MPKIADAHILILATDGFEESELFGPREILMGRDARVSLASPTLTPIQATVMDDPGKTIRPDAERETNSKIMTCCSRAQSGRLVLEI